MVEGESLISTAITGSLIAASSSALLVAIVRRRAMAFRLVDVPNERSSHSVPTPTGGGIGILMGMFVGLLAARAIAPGSMPGAAATLVGLAFLIGLVGLVDDRRRIPATLRLLMHLAAATVLVLVLGPIPAFPVPAPFSLPLASPPASFPMTVLWIAGVTSFFNFMDGVDGLAGGQAVVSSVGIAIAGWSEGSTVVALALAGASVGFLVHNWPPARIFMGDVGSGAVGFLLAGLPLLAPPARRPEAVLAVGLGLTFFILDPLLTLARRAIARKPLMLAHREHLYQTLIPAGTPGTRTTAFLLAGAGFLALAGALSFHAPEVAWPALGCAIGLFLVECIQAFRVSTRIRRAGQEVSPASAAEAEKERNAKPKG